MKLENWEIQSMKDDLYNLGYELEGTRDGNTVKKALDYIIYLEEKLEKASNNKERAKELLKEKGYLIIKPTKGQLADSKRCEELSENGEEMNCECCDCSCCLMQQ